MKTWKWRNLILPPPPPKSFCIFSTPCPFRSPADFFLKNQFSTLTIFFLKFHPSLRKGARGNYAGYHGIKYPARQLYNFWLMDMLWLSQSCFTVLFLIKPRISCLFFWNERLHSRINIWITNFRLQLFQNK